MKSYIILLVFLIKYIDAGTFRCDYRYSSKANGWFKNHEIPANWVDARLRCALEGSVLASPTTPEITFEMGQVARNSTPNVRQIYTGLNAYFSKGAYYTVDGIPLEKFTHKWAQGQPNNLDDKERCLTMTPKGELSDVNCDTPFPYVCFKSNDPEVMTNECGTTDPEYKLDARTKKCYKFHTVARNFSRAHFACSAEGGHLAIINSQEESVVLRELYAKYPAHTMTGNFWKDAAYIGFHSWNEGNDWRTIHGQTLKEAGFAGWSGGLPDNVAPGEQCGSIFRTGLLNDLWCEKLHPFICEKDPLYPRVCSNVKNYVNSPISNASPKDDNENSASSNVISDDN